VWPKLRNTHTRPRLWEDADLNFKNIFTEDIAALDTAIKLHFFMMLRIIVNEPLILKKQLYADQIVAS